MYVLLCKNKVTELDERAVSNCLEEKKIWYLP